jgi:dimethylargininase
MSGTSEGAARTGFEPDGIVYSVAIVRSIGPTFSRALCAVAPAEPIDPKRAAAQHAAYVGALRACGLEVVVLGADERFADGCFVEDRAVIAAGRALVTRSAAPSRDGESEALLPVLRRYASVVEMKAPATLDGGDCLRVGKRFFVGRSARTNAAGVEALREAFAPLGFEVHEVDVPDVLHLKCVCAPLGEARITLAEGTVDPSLFQGVDVVQTPADEAYAANCVALGNQVLVSDGFPETRRRLDAQGLRTISLDTSEIRKADGALTCMSLLLVF